MTRRSIYIDIDGVCLRHASAYSSRTGVELAPHAFQFLRWAAGAHNPYWLTTRDAHGQHDGILRAFRLAIGSPTLPTEVEALLKSIKPTTWHGSKVSGIDLGSDFVWIDDQPLMVEIDALQGRNLLSRLIVIDTNKDDDALLRAIDAINSLSKIPHYKPHASHLSPRRGPRKLKSARRSSDASRDATLQEPCVAPVCSTRVYHSGGPNPDVIGVFVIPMS